MDFHISVYTVENIFLWLIIYSVIGWIYESTLCSITERRFVNRGFLNGPYCPIYGFGAILDILILGWIENPILLFVLSAILTCTLEYITSYLMEKLFHARWWDYSNRKFNINGRVCLIGAVVFGTLSLILIKLVHPLVLKMIGMMNDTLFHTIVIALAVIFITDNVITIAGFCHFDKKIKKFADEFKIQTEKLSENIKVKTEDITEDIKVKAENIKAKTENIKNKTNIQVPSVFSDIQENLAKKFNFQEKRMLKAFPKFKSINYNEVLEDLKEKLKIKRRK